MKALSLLLLTVSSAFAQLTVSGPSAGDNDPRISGTGPLVLGSGTNKFTGSITITSGTTVLVLSGSAGQLTVNGAAAGGGNPFNQSLNTTNSPTFGALTVTGTFSAGGGGFAADSYGSVIMSGQSLTLTNGGNLTVNGHVNFDDSNISSDGSGNLTAGSFVGPATAVADEGLSSYAGTIGTGAIIHVPTEASAAVGQACEDAVTHVVKIKQ